MDEGVIKHVEAPVYTVANPHPGFGKDPNILNEFGHSAYPRWVDHPTLKEDKEGRFPKRVLVQNAQEEKALGSEKPEAKNAKGAGWDK